MLKGDDALVHRLRLIVSRCAKVRPIRERWHETRMRSSAFTLRRMAEPSQVSRKVAWIQSILLSRFWFQVATVAIPLECRRLRSEARKAT